MVNDADRGLPALFTMPKSMSREAAEINRKANEVINPGEVEEANKIEAEKEE